MFSGVLPAAKRAVRAEHERHICPRHPARAYRAYASAKVDTNVIALHLEHYNNLTITH